MTDTRFDFIVSSENCEYLAWQSLVVHYSCLSQFAVAPLIVVHGDEPRLIEPYRRLQAKGGRVSRAPNYRRNRGCEYPPRNTAATLLHAASNADYLILIDPDIVFVDARLADHHFEPDAVSFDSVSYLGLDDGNRAELTAACARLGVGLDAVDDPQSSGGVPHVIPRPAQAPLAREWLACLDAFYPENLGSAFGGTTLCWRSLASMWSLRIAARRIGLRPTLTRYCETNQLGGRTWPDANHQDACIIHYCYGDAEFDKRSFPALDARARARLLYPVAGTVNGVIRENIEAALRDFGY